MVSFACVLALVDLGDEYVFEEPVEYAYEDQAFRLLGELCRQDDHTLEITSIFAC